MDDSLLSTLFQDYKEHLLDSSTEVNKKLARLQTSLPPAEWQTLDNLLRQYESFVFEEAAALSQRASLSGSTRDQLAERLRRLVIDDAPGSDAKFVVPKSRDPYETAMGSSQPKPVVEPEPAPIEDEPSPEAIRAARLAAMRALNEDAPVSEPPPVFEPPPVISAGPPPPAPTESQIAVLQGAAMAMAAAQSPRQSTALGDAMEVDTPATQPAAVQSPVEVDDAMDVDTPVGRPMAVQPPIEVQPVPSAILAPAVATPEPSPVPASRPAELVPRKSAKAKTQTRPEVPFAFQPEPFPAAPVTPDDFQRARETRERQEKELQELRELQQGAAMYAASGFGVITPTRGEPAAALEAPRATQVVEPAPEPRPRTDPDAMQVDTPAAFASATSEQKRVAASLWGDEPAVEQPAPAFAIVKQPAPAFAPFEQPVPDFATIPAFAPTKPQVKKRTAITEFVEKAPLSEGTTGRRKTMKLSFDSGKSKGDATTEEERKTRRELEKAIQMLYTAPRIAPTEQDVAIGRYMVGPAKASRKPMKTPANIAKLIMPVHDWFENSVVYVPATHGPIIEALRNSKARLVASEEEARNADFVIFYAPTPADMQAAIALRPTMILTQRRTRLATFNLPEDYKVVRTDQGQGWLFYKLLDDYEVEEIRKGQEQAIRDEFGVDENGKAISVSKNGDGDGEEAKKDDDLGDDEDEEEIGEDDDDDDEDGASKEAMERKREEMAREALAEYRRSGTITEYALEDHIRYEQHAGSTTREEDYLDLVQHSRIEVPVQKWAEVFDTIQRLAWDFVCRSRDLTKEEARVSTLFWIVAERGDMPTELPPIVDEDGVDNSAAAAEAVFGERLVFGSTWQETVQTETGPSTVTNHFPPQNILRNYANVFTIFLYPEDAERALWYWDFGFGEVILPDGTAENTALFESPDASPEASPEGNPEASTSRRLAGIVCINPWVHKVGGRWTVETEQEKKENMKVISAVSARAVHNFLVPYKGLENPDSPDPTQGNPTTLEALDYLHMLHDTNFVRAVEAEREAPVEQAMLSMFTAPYLFTASAPPAYRHGYMNQKLQELALAGKAFGSQGLMALFDHFLYNATDKGEWPVKYASKNRPKDYTQQISPLHYAALIDRILGEWEDMIEPADMMEALMLTLRSWRSMNPQLEEAKKELTDKDLQFLREFARAISKHDDGKGFPSQLPKSDILLEYFEPEEIADVFTGPLQRITPIPDAPFDEGDEEEEEEDLLAAELDPAALEALNQDLEKNTKMLEALSKKKGEPIPLEGKTDRSISVDTAMGATFLLYGDLKRGRTVPTGDNLNYDTNNPVYPYQKAFKTVIQRRTGLPAPKVFVVPDKSPDGEALLNFKEAATRIPTPILRTNEELAKWNYDRPAYVAVSVARQPAEATLRNAVEYLLAHRAHLDGIGLLDLGYDNTSVATKKESVARLTQNVQIVGDLFRQAGLEPRYSIFAPGAIVYFHRLKIGEFTWPRGPFHLFDAMYKANIGRASRIDLLSGDEVSQEVLIASRDWGLPPIVSEREAARIRNNKETKIWTITTNLQDMRGVVNAMALNGREGLVLVDPDVKLANDRLRAAVAELVRADEAGKGPLAGWHGVVEPPFAVVSATKAMRKETKTALEATLSPAERAAAKPAPVPSSTTAQKKKKRKTPESGQAEAESEAKRQKLTAILSSPTRLTAALTIALRGLFGKGSWLALSYSDEESMKVAQETALKLKALIGVSGADFRFHPDVVILDSRNPVEEYRAKCLDYILRAKTSKYSLVIICLDDASTRNWLKSLSEQWPAKASRKKKPEASAGDAMEVDQKKPKKGTKSDADEALQKVVVLGPSIELPDEYSNVSKKKDLWSKFDTVEEAGVKRPQTHLEWALSMLEKQILLKQISKDSIAQNAQEDYKVFIEGFVYYWNTDVRVYTVSELKKRFESLAVGYGSSRHKRSGK